jgi:hypothetical protein
VNILLLDYIDVHGMELVELLSGDALEGLVKRASKEGSSSVDV